MEIKRMENVQVMTWGKAKSMLIPEAQTNFLILKVLVAKICANICSDIYFAKQQGKGLGFWKTVKLYLWAFLNLFLRYDVEPYLMSNIINKELKDES